MRSQNIKHLAQRLITDEVIAAVETVLMKHLLFAQERKNQFRLGLVEDQIENESLHHLKEVQAICKVIHTKISELNTNIDLPDHNMFSHPTFEGSIIQKALNSTN